MANKIEQIERIKHYSKLLKDGEKVIKDLIDAIKAFNDFEKQYKEIDAYYTSEERFIDLDLYENHEFPEGLDCGILGEDYPWDFLSSYESFKEYLKDID